MFDSLAAPREGSRELPTWRNLPSVKCAGRQSLLVNSRLKLLGVNEMAPAALERESGGRVPRQTDRRGVERPRFNVPATLVGLPSVEAADLNLEAVKDETDA